MGEALGESWGEALEGGREGGGKGCRDGEIKKYEWRNRLVKDSERAWKEESHHVVCFFGFFFKRLYIMSCRAQVPVGLDLHHCTGGCCRGWVAAGQTAGCTSTGLAALQAAPQPQLCWPGTAWTALLSPAWEDWSTGRQNCNCRREMEGKMYIFT